MQAIAPKVTTAPEQFTFDVIIIGGGATGFGVALESILRGYSTLLLEAGDFAQGASSKSTKLVHGGIRYLANLDFALVKEGLKERHYFLHNAPHLSRMLGFVVPFYSLWNKIKYSLGVWLYDLLAGKYKLKASHLISKQDIITRMPDLSPHRLLGGAVYYDGIFDDSRMIISLFKTFRHLGGVAYNYCPVNNFIQNNNGQICGVRTNNNDTFYAQVVINATGAFSDIVCKLDLVNLNNTGGEKVVDKHCNKVNTHKNDQRLHQQEAVTHVAPSRGAHLVFQQELFRCHDALVIPKTSDGRILFIVPWHVNTIIVGTTDTLKQCPKTNPIVTDEEIDFILTNVNHYTIRQLTRKDIVASFVGDRPLVVNTNSRFRILKKLLNIFNLAKSRTYAPRASNHHIINSSKISRKHRILLSKNKLVSIIGGKWTIYRKMGEDTIEFIIRQGLLKKNAITHRNNHKVTSKNLILIDGIGINKDNNYDIDGDGGATSNSKDGSDANYSLRVYGNCYNDILAICRQNNDFSYLHAKLPYLTAEVIYQVRHEMARTIDDVLARRTRSLLINQQASLEAAPKVAEIIAKEYGLGHEWIEAALKRFYEQYIYE